MLTMQTQTPIGDRIRSHMRDRRITQDQLAALLNLTRQSVSLRLLGRVEWRISELTAIATHLGIPLSDLLGDAA